MTRSNDIEEDGEQEFQEVLQTPRKRRETTTSRLEDVKEEEHEEDSVRAEDSFFSTGKLESDNNNSSPYSVPFQEWKLAQDMLRNDETSTPNDSSSAAKQQLQENHMKNHSAEAVTLLPQNSLEDATKDFTDTTTTTHHDGREIPLAEPMPSPRKRRQRRCIYVLSILALFLTVTVILIAVLTVSSKDPSKNDESSSLKDPPFDVTAPPPTSLAPIVPGQPTLAPNTHPPSSAPVTDRPTVAPVEQQDVDLEALKLLLNVDPSVFNETTYNNALRTIGTNAPDIQQRFAVAVLNYALKANFAVYHMDTCDWFGVTCVGRQVTKIAWEKQVLTGTLPTTGLQALTKLTELDLGENDIGGSIPSGMYQDLSALKFLYLHENQLTGGLSTEIGRLKELERLYLGGNRLTGLLPQELGSPSVGGANVRPLEYISLYGNQFVGPIPRKWNLRRLYYLDLGRNQLSGGFPEDWTVGRDTMDRLRLLYLDHNRLGGTLPANLGEIGKGRLNLLAINDNSFTGTMPLFQNYTNFLNRLEIHNNDFTAMNRFQCAQIVFNGGELVQMKADCEICNCLFLCDQCY